MSEKEFIYQADGVTITPASIKIDGVDLSHAALSQKLPTNTKCCKGCAFRVGSPERSDPWKWGDLCDAFSLGGAFLCHEGIPGHQQAVEGRPLALCAGRAALEGAGFRTMLNLAHVNVHTEAPDGE